MTLGSLLRTCCILAACAGTSFAQSLYVEASRDALVRDRPDATAEVLLRLRRADQLNLVTPDQINAFYNVALPDGREGFVSRYTVRLRRGAAPDAPPVAPAPAVPTGLTAIERENAAFHFAVVGKPKGYSELIRRGYAVGYDPWLKIPVWVQYRLTEERSESDIVPRSNAFDEDGAVPPQARAILDDYAQSGYARGHMAPADDMRWHPAAEAESNWLTNIAPQVGSSFNGSVWGSLEGRIRGWVKDRRDLVIICGPVFAPLDTLPAAATPRQPPTPKQFRFNAIGEAVAVPTHFFKVVVDLSHPDRPEVLAFLMPHVETTPGPERAIDSYLTTVDEIERLTGLDLLPGFPDQLEESLESVRRTSSW